MILAGDIGGTKTRIAYFTTDAGRLCPLIEETFPSREYGSLDEIVQAFRAKHQVTVTQAGFGIAGPVKNGRSETTNLPWVVDARALADRLEIASVVLLNDLEANAYGIAALAADDFVVLNPGAPDAAGNAAIIAAGTGLGEAGFYWDGQTHQPFACEGGHADFAPRNELEMDLLRYLLTRFTRVSYERVLSGPGCMPSTSFCVTPGAGKSRHGSQRSCSNAILPPSSPKRRCQAGARCAYRHSTSLSPSTERRPVIWR